MKILRFFVFAYCFKALKLYRVQLKEVTLYSNCLFLKRRERTIFIYLTIMCLKNVMRVYHS